MASVADAIEAIANKDPSLIVLEQVQNLYGRLYPFMVGLDFFSRDDLLVAFGAIFQELVQIKTLLQAHTHSAPNAPMTGAVLPTSIAVIPTPALGVAKVLPPGTPDPTMRYTGLLPQKVGTIPFTPPIDPSLLT
jgi:hypothetical protein